MQYVASAPAATRPTPPFHAHDTPHASLPFSTPQSLSGGTVLSTNWKDVAKKDYEKERKGDDADRDDLRRDGDGYEDEMS